MQGGFDYSTKTDECYECIQHTCEFHKNNPLTVDYAGCTCGITFKKLT